MTCPYCGAELPADALFCGECGRALASVNTPDAEVVDAQEPAPLPPITFVEPDQPDLWADPPAAQPIPDQLVEPEPQEHPAERPAAERFVLQFSTGESVTTYGTGLVGRNPIAEPGEYFDQLVTIVDPGKSVSKTHLEFGQSDGEFWISDRFSGNGTVVREPEIEPKRGDAGKRYRISRGTRVDIGEQFFVVS